MKEEIIKAYEALPTCSDIGMRVAREYESHKVLSPLQFLRGIFGKNKVPGPPASDSCDPTYSIMIEGEEYELSNPTQEVFLGWIS